MLVPIALLAASLVGAAPAKGAPAGARRGRETPLQLALRLASARHPGVTWRAADARTGADLTYDAVPDLVLLGAQERGVVVAVVEGPVTERSRVLDVRLRAGVAAPDAICGSPLDLQANVERPDARALVPPASDETRALVDAGADAGGVGLVLVHAGPIGYCEAFHVLYDGTALAWWRGPGRSRAPSRRRPGPPTRPTAGTASSAPGSSRRAWWQCSSGSASAEAC